MNRLPRTVFLFSVLLVAMLSRWAGAAQVLSADDVIATQTCSAHQISPDGKWIAYTVSRTPAAADPAGAAYSELFVVSTRTGEVRPFVTGKVRVSSPRFSPDGSSIGFLTSRGEEAKTQVWSIPLGGGEATQITRSKSNVSFFRWHPSGKQVAYIATTPVTERETALEEKGYGIVFYEEQLKHRNIYLLKLKSPQENQEPVQLTQGKSAWSFEFSPDGKMIAAAMSPKNLVDHHYMFSRIYRIDVRTKKSQMLVDNPGKLGSYSFSPDGRHLVYTAAMSRMDHAVSQVYVIKTSGGKAKNLTVGKFKGHVSWAGFIRDGAILYLSAEGTRSTYSIVSIKGGRRRMLLDTRKNGLVFGRPSYTKDFRQLVFRASTPKEPSALYHWIVNKKPRKMTTLNPWIAQRRLGKQTVFKFKARDGVTVEGPLIYPVGYVAGNTYPLIVYVHGGPEARRADGWNTFYSSPAQVMAGKGYLVFMPNYRASTGYGLEFAHQGFEDPAGKEFDDIADSIDALVKKGLADRERVGLAGGSYGGYAAAWFATYYTKYVRAVCVFVGISNLISKRGTTDIPYEELYVHSGKPLEQMWELSLKRSPIYWAHQSKSAVLIYGGTADTRIHPEQSLELYRRLKMNNHPAVRLVQYPGEGHGNRNRPGRVDVLHRQIEWFDWYVKNKKPLNGPKPPLDLSKHYELDLPK